LNQIKKEAVDADRERAEALANIKSLKQKLNE